MTTDTAKHTPAQSVGSSGNELAKSTDGRRFQALLLATASLVWATDADGRIVQPLPAWAEFTGKSFDEYRDSGWLDAVHPDDREHARQVWAAGSGRVIELQYRIRDRDGEWRPMRVRWAPVSDERGRCVEWIAAATDVSESVRASDALRAARQRAAVQLDFTRSITDSLGEGLYAVDLEGRATFVNPAACRMLGYDAEELIGKDIHEQIHYQHSDGSAFPRETCPLIDVIHTGKAVTVEDDAFVGRDGTMVPVSYTSSPTREEGKITGAVVAFRDITERKTAEAALRRYSDELERMVRERTAELEATNTQLRASNRELEDFASVASHDLQEPLRKIQAFGDRLVAKAGPSLGDEGQDYLRRMRAAAGRMQTLIADLLAFSRVTTRAQPFTRVDLNQIAGEVLADLETSLEQTGGRVEVADLPQIEADPMQMRQLVQNLVGNALKFHKPDVPPLVRIYAETGGAVEPAACRLVVRDNGIGFDEKYLDRIFNVFQRLHGRGQYEGTGIGLAVCRKIAERHGGSITARSAPEEGSSFVVTLPMRQPTVEATTDGR